MLKAKISLEQFNSISTAIRYNQMNAVVIVVIGLALLSQGTLTKAFLIAWVGYLFILATFLFSFSIYTAILFNLPKLLSLAPIGGVVNMLAWLLLLIYGVLALNK